MRYDSRPAAVAKLVDAGDLKFPALWACRFDSGRPHQHALPLDRYKNPALGGVFIACRISVATAQSTVAELCLDTLVLPLDVDADRRRRTGQQARDANRITGLFTVAVILVLDAAQCFIDLLQQQDSRSRRRRSSQCSSSAVARSAGSANTSRSCRRSLTSSSRCRTSWRICSKRCRKKSSCTSLM
jgi:hypothetical protein